tara:strand:- start:189 stop:1238 length:1050 start_codon:yes stop_codon:yes gene_type:complete
MATSTLTIQNEVISTTMHILMDEWRDGLSQAVAFLDAQNRVHSEGQPSQDGGSQMVVPLALNNHSTTTRIQTGFERIDLTVQDVFVPAQYGWGHVVRPVAISSEEEFVNQGDSQVISILEARTRMTANELKRQFSEQMSVGGVTGWEDWETLNGIPAAATGFLEDRAVSAQTNTVGGVNKGTYSGTTGWQHQFASGGTISTAGNFNNNGLASLYDVLVEIRSVSADGDPDIILASREGFKNLKRSLSAQERYVDQAAIDGGRMIQTWDGIQIAVDRFLPGTDVTSAISFYFLNLKDIHCTWSPQGYFDLSDFQTVSGEYDVRAAKMRTRGQLVAKHLGSSALVVNLDTF